MKHTGLMFKLIDHGVALIEIDFDGQGDQGEIVDIRAKDAGNKYMDVDIYGLLEDTSYDIIDSMVNTYGGDWVNNDGGYGSVYIDVSKKKVTGSYYQRTVEEFDWHDELFK